MTSDVSALVFAANDPSRVAAFWAAVLDGTAVEDAHEGVVLLPADARGLRIRFLATEARKTGPNQMHFDLTSSSLQDQHQTVTRALEQGGRHIDVGQLPEEDHVVLADPEGNEFCVVGPDNSFLRGCGTVGALSSDGSQQVGYFWSEALGWPLVWDQDEETAIQSPAGGTKISWGGPPFAPRSGRNRLHLDLAPTADTDPLAEVDRLLCLGATRLDPRDSPPLSGCDGAGWVGLADPDGNEFCVAAS
jgi:predicted enzyme related to lactoylglutathione lyase